MADVKISDVVVDSSLKGVVFDLIGRSAANYSPSTTAYDCAIGGLPFIYATSDKYPYQRQTVQFRKWRVDQERDVGEQSLDSGTWYRAGSSYHYGSGQKVYETVETNDAIARFRFNRSFGVDPWTKGQLGLNYNASLRQAASATKVLAVGVSNGVFLASGTTASFLYDTSVSSTSTSVTGFTGTIKAVASDGYNVWIATLNGSTWTVWVTNVDVSWYCTSWVTGIGTYVTATDNVTLTFAKGRLWLTGGVYVWEITNATTTAVIGVSTTGANPARVLPADVLSVGWQWADVAESPTSVYLAGYNNDVSVVYQLKLTGTTTSVDITKAVPVLDMPRGEVVTSMYGYLGSFVGIGTNKGLRIAQVQSDGTLALGALITTSSSVTDMVGYDKFLYATLSGAAASVDFIAGSDNATVAGSGIMKVDLSAQLPDGRYAYSNDLVTTQTGTVQSVTTNIYGTVYFTINGYGLYEKSSSRAAVGWLETGKFRFNTLEPNAWRSLRMVASCPGATRIEAYASMTSTGTWQYVGQVNGSYTEMLASLEAICQGQVKEIWLAFRFIRDEANPTFQPVLYGWQVRAVPLPRRQRVIQAPLLMFDFEQDHNGLKVGQRGGAWKRLQALEALEQSSGVLLWQDFSTGESTTVTIEEVSFSRLNPPTRNFSGSGGLCMLTLRTV